MTQKLGVLRQFVSKFPEFSIVAIVEMDIISEENFQIRSAPSFCGKLTILAVHGLVEILDDSKTRGLASVCIEIS